MAGANYNLFRGRDATLQAYTFNKVAPWAIFVGKELMCSYNDENLAEGAEVLGEFMDAMVDNKMEGTYQLRMYRVIPPNGIMNNTPYSYSFKFQLYGEDDYQQLNPMHMQLKALKEEIRQLKEDKDQEDEDEFSWKGQIGAIMKDPETRRMLVMGIAGFVRNMFNKFSPPAGMAGTPTMEPTGTGQPTMADLFNRLSIDEQEKFNQATYFLLSKDPKIGTNLLKLAELLNNNPGMYDSLTRMTV